VITSQDQLTNAVETLECYGINSCSDYPAAPFVEMGSINLEVQGSSQLSPFSWSEFDVVTDCGQHAIVVIDTPTGGEVDLYFSA
jgi:hypothetical protein